MTITYTWNIVALNSVPKAGIFTDSVCTSHWTLTATDGTYTGSVYGSVSFEVNPDKSDYTPYNQLTLDEVISWTQASLGAEQVASYEKTVADQIEVQIIPDIVTLPLPWAVGMINSASEV